MHKPPRSAATADGQPLRLRADHLDPEAKALLRLLNLGVRRPVDRANLTRQRLGWRLAARALGQHNPAPRVRSLSVPGPAGPIVLKLYRPASNAPALPAFLWIHGGGFIVGGLETADAICLHLAQASGALVVAVRYRLAPEHDLYAGREDCLAALQWIAREGTSVGIDPTRLAIGGDSAGGNLAAAVAQRFTQQCGTGLRLQVLVYPATNLRDDFPSKVENQHGFLLTSRGIDAMKALLRERRPDLADPWLSPALAGDLRGLPPALMVTAGFDPIRDDGLAYARQLRHNGVGVDLLHYAGQFHGFLNFNGVLRAARDALDRIGEALRRALDASAQASYTADRTTEVTAHPTRIPLLLNKRFGGDLMLLGLMLGERLEDWRDRTAIRMFPMLGLGSRSLVFSPATLARAMLARELAPLQAVEIYSRESVAAP